MEILSTQSKNLINNPFESLKIGLFLFFSLLLVGCGEHNNDSLKQKSLVYCSEGSPNTFNPQQATSSITFDASARVLFDRLIDQDENSGEILPALANSWNTSADGKHYIFKLRKDVSFHSTKFWQPTREFNADDVLFSFRRQLVNHHPYHNAGTGNYPLFKANGLHHLIKDIIKIDAHTVEFILNKSANNFLSIIAMDFLSIQSAEYAESMQADRNNFDLHPIGTGPFYLQQYVADRYIRYYANNNYWRGDPEIETLVFSISPISSNRLAKLLTAECDLMAQPEPNQIDIINQYDSIELQTQAGMNVAYWAFNLNKKPFQDVRVRTALAYAISRKTIINVVYNNAAILARSPIPPSMLAASKPTPTIEQNQQLSRELLAEANWDPEKIIEIWAMPVQRPYNPNARKMALLMQHDLQQVGVKSRIVSYEWSQFLQRVKQGQHDTVLLGWSADNNDADAFLNPLLSCDGAETDTNRAFWCNPDFDQQLFIARETTGEVRIKALQQAQQIFKTDLPWLAIAHSKRFLAWRKGVYGVKLSKTGSIDFSKISKTETSLVSISESTETVPETINQ